MNEEILLRRLKKKSKRIMEKGNHHDFAHVINVYQNVEKLLKHMKGDRLVLLTASLFHDVKRDSKNHSVKGAEYTRKILKATADFPQHKIDQVIRIIKSHSHIKIQKSSDEKIFYDADKMDAFSEIGIVRSFMMYSEEGVSLREACIDYIKLIEKFYNRLHTDVAKKLIKKDYEKTKHFAQNLIKNYK